MIRVEDIKVGDKLEILELEERAIQIIEFNGGR